jgi:RNA polymerase sigma factor (sigma-70 family)
VTRDRSSHRGRPCVIESVSQCSGRAQRLVSAGISLEIVARLIDGEPAAFQAVYEAYRARLYTFLLRLTRNEQLAADLAQESWLRLATHARRLAPDSDPGAWLFRVARNLFHSQRRWTLLDRERVAEWGLRTAGLEPASPLLEAAEHERGRRIERAIASLPLAYREVLLLVAVEGFEGPEAAELLSLRPAALRQRLARARAMLRAALGEEEP